MDDLGSADSLGFALHELVALGKATLSKELALDVLAVGDLSILMLDTLFDDLSVCVRIPTGGMEIGLTAAGCGSSLHQLMSGCASSSPWP